jgi:hypothetical protein
MTAVSGHAINGASFSIVLPVCFVGSLGKAPMPSKRQRLLLIDPPPWLNGKPYYCKLCGAGLAEFMACEMPDCEIESVETAKARVGSGDPAA